MPQTWYLYAGGALLLAAIILLVCVLVSNSRNRHATEELTDAINRKFNDGELALEQVEVFLHRLEKAVPRLLNQAGSRGAEDVLLALEQAGHIALPAAPHPSQHHPQQLSSHEAAYDEGYAGDGRLVVQQADWVGEPDQMSQLDHPGARAQLAARAGLPDPQTFLEPAGLRPAGTPPPGYTLVAVGNTDGHVTPTYPQLGPEDFPRFTPAHQGGDTQSGDALTETFSAIKNEPEEFHASNFERRPGESQAEFEERVGLLQAQYEAHLARERMEVTGSFPAGLGDTPAARAALAASNGHRQQ